MFNLASFVIPCNCFWETTDFQCCNYCHLLRHFSSKIQSSMTICHHIFSKTKLWIISVDYKLLKHGIAQSSRVDEILGHVRVLIRIHLLGFFCLFLIIWRRLNPLWVWSKSHIFLEPMQWLWNVTCLGMKKADKNPVCMGSLPSKWACFPLILYAFCIGFFALCLQKKTLDTNLSIHIYIYI
jgi:hypothetical protein